MRIAAFADVHGNPLALEAVLGDIATSAVDVTVDLGDLLSGGVQPRETAERLLPLHLPTVRGNHERQLTTTPPERLASSDRLAYDTLRVEHLRELASLPTTVRLADGVLACHGSPTDDLTYLLETVEPTGARAATPDEVLERLGVQAQERLVLCGHSHLQRALQLPGGALIVNPGSVGWPAFDDDQPYPHVMEAGSPHARYAVLDDARGRWEATFRALEYDWERSARIAEGNGRPDVARALRTGRV
jgi:predicted phosphodiesterase